MYIRIKQGLGQPPEVVKDYEEQKRRFERAKAEHEKRLAALRAPKSVPQNLEQVVKDLMKQLQPLFLKNFSKNRVTYGPKVGASVKFRILPDKDFITAQVEEAKRLADAIELRLLKLAPEIVLRKLEGFYRAIRQPFPTRLKIINEKTQLTRDEKAAIFPLMKVLTIEKIKADAGKTGAFYSLTTQEMVFRASQIDAGTVAHEMAHAYANQGWHDFIYMMQLRSMQDTAKLDEGMAAHIERIIVRDWFTSQPSSTTIPMAKYDSSYTDRAAEFVRLLGADQAYEAYFGGYVDFTNNDKPEDTLVIGNKTKKKWKWPWR